MNLVGILIAVSLLLLAGLGIAGALLMGGANRYTDADEPEPRDH